LGVALGRTCAVLAPGADAAVLAIVVPRGMRPRRTAGAAKQAARSSGNGVTWLRACAPQRFESSSRDLLARIFGTQLGARSALRLYHKPLCQKLSKQSTTVRGNAHRCEYKFCTSTRVDFLTILHSTVLSDTTSRSSILLGQSPATASL